MIIKLITTLAKRAIARAHRAINEYEAEQRAKRYAANSAQLQAIQELQRQYEWDAAIALARAAAEADEQSLFVHSPGRFEN